MSAEIVGRVGSARDLAGAAPPTDDDVRSRETGVDSTLENGHRLLEEINAHRDPLTRRAG